MPDPIKTDDVVVENPEVTPVEKKEPESKESVISKITQKISNFVSGEKKDEGDFFPDDFVEAARKKGWSDDDIQSFAGNFEDEELRNMIPEILGTEQDSELSDDSTVQPEKKVEQPTKTEDNNSQEDEAVKKLLARIEALEKAQGKTEENDAEKEFANRVRRATQIMDEKSNEFKMFGKSDSLPTFPDGRIIMTSPQAKARLEVWDLANTLTEAGVDFENAMSISLDAYKGRHLEKDVKRNLIKDLNKNESLLTGKRTTHESSPTAISGADVIREVARRHGREMI